ncbi:hypothetical protein H4R19_000467 [Coemansia spiralis]|nr:hypothetical protein H4R19_000467 [Coemansia spiralis]
MAATQGCSDGPGTPAGERTPLLFVGYCPPPKPLSAEDIAQRRRSLGIVSELSVDLLSAGPTPECLSACDSANDDRAPLPGGAAGEARSEWLWCRLPRHLCSSRTAPNPP